MSSVEETTLPRYALFRGKRVRIVSYVPATATIGARFGIIEPDDSQRHVRRDQLTFLKEEK